MHRQEFVRLMCIDKCIDKYVIMWRKLCIGKYKLVSARIRKLKQVQNGQLLSRIEMYIQGHGIDKGRQEYRLDCRQNYVEMSLQTFLARKRRKKGKDKPE